MANCDQCSPKLDGDIYNLVDSYIPDDFKDSFDEATKKLFIEKWQMYLFEIVDREDGCEIPCDQWNVQNEYTGLENYLIMQLAAYDHLKKVIETLMRKLSVAASESSSSTGGDADDTNQRIKQITTGPTDVSFYEGLSGESASSALRNLAAALAPGGYVDTLKQDICMLARRVNVYLYWCPQYSQVVHLQKITRRHPGRYGGPNPRGGLNK